jgi:hypothetical protein
MIRTFNYTGRKSLPKEQIQVRLHRTVPAMSFDAALMDFDKLQFPDSARIFVEAYHQSVYMRFDFGTKGSITIPPVEERFLADFYDGSPVNFRVKIVDESSEHGQILAEADAIRPVRDDDDVKGNPLLPVRMVGGMGQEIWRLVWDSRGPIVELNQELPGIKERLIKETRFRSLILSGVLREVLTHVLSFGLDESDEYEEMATKWLKFASKYYAEEPPTPDERGSIGKVQEWVQQVLKPFCEKHQFFNHWKEAINPTVEE